MRVALVAIATNKYLDLVLNMLKSASEHFMRGHDVGYILFTNRDDDPRLREIANLVAVHCEHTPWPGPALQRYRLLASQAQRLTTFDYVFYVDADMEFVGDVGNEVLGTLVGTRHPFFYTRRHRIPIVGPRRLPFERNPRSLAYVSIRDGRTYYQSCFFGGKSSEFVKLSRSLEHAIEADNALDIVAIWHDESHLNRYFIGHPPEISLSPAYAFPRGSHLPFEPKIEDVQIDWAVYHTE